MTELSYDALGQTTAYTYDPMDRLVKEVSPGGRETRYTYDQNSDLTAITDGNGHTTRFSYALTGGAAMPVLLGAAQAGGMGAFVSGAVAGTGRIRTGPSETR